METIQAYNERNISGIKEEDINISITGTVVNREENGFVVDDGSQSLKVLMENSVKDNDYVRIFGKLVRSNEGLVLYGDAIQDLSKIDKFLYQKVRKMLHGELS